MNTVLTQARALFDFYYGDTRNRRDDDARAADFIQWEPKSIPVLAE